MCYIMLRDKLRIQNIRQDSWRADTYEPVVQGTEGPGKSHSTMLRGRNPGAQYFCGPGFVEVWEERMAQWFLRT